VLLAIGQVKTHKKINVYTSLTYVVHVMYFTSVKGIRTLIFNNKHKRTCIACMVHAMYMPQGCPADVIVFAWVVGVSSYGRLNILRFIALAY